MQMLRRRVVLFRDEVDGDPYRRHLERAGFEVAFIPVLSFEPINQDQLRDALSTPDSFGGLIVTSERAANRVLEESGSINRWHDRRLYSIGPRTSAVLGSDSWRAPVVTAPTGDELARLIVETYQDSLPLLFPCSTRRRDTIPSLPASAGIQVEEIHAYDTLPVEPVDAADSEPPTWVVCFSPSGVEAVSSMLAGPWSESRRAAIGQTTATALQDAGVPPDAVADEPDPESVVAALVRATGATDPSGRRTAG